MTCCVQPVSLALGYFIFTPANNVTIEPERTLSSLELLLVGLHQPELSKTPPLRLGAPCPQCGEGRLDYNGLLQLECPLCGFVNGEGGSCT
jgi:hypothetical protein